MSTRRQSSPNPPLEFQADLRLAGAKVALKIGRAVVVSPALFDLFAHEDEAGLRRLERALVVLDAASIKGDPFRAALQYDPKRDTVNLWPGDWADVRVPGKDL